MATVNCQEKVLADLGCANESYAKMSKCQLDLDCGHHELQDIEVKARQE